MLHTIQTRQYANVPELISNIFIVFYQGLRLPVYTSVWTGFRHCTKQSKEKLIQKKSLK